MPIASRSSDDKRCGSTVTGSGGARPRSILSRPAAISPPKARYGLQDASIGLYSRLAEAISWPQNVEGTRTAASRLSGPQHTYAELQCSGRRRWKELSVG